MVGPTAAPKDDTTLNNFFNTAHYLEKVLFELKKQLQINLSNPIYYLHANTAM